MSRESATNEIFDSFLGFGVKITYIEADEIVGRVQALLNEEQGEIKKKATKVKKECGLNLFSREKLRALDLNYSIFPSSPPQYM